MGVEDSPSPLDETPEVILDRISDVFFALDADWRITYLSGKAKDLVRRAMDVPPEAVLGESLWELLPEATDSLLYEKFTEAMETQEAVEFETESVLEEGWREVRAYPSEDGLSVYFRDITDRKERERDRERRYEAIFNQTYQFTGLMEPDGTLIEANEAALEFGGLDSEDVLGKPFWEAHWWQIDEQTQAELRDAIERAAEGEFVRYEVDVQGEDDTITIDFSLRPVTNDDGEVTYLIPEGRNITELKAVKERERELEQIREQMEFALDAKDSLIWSVNLATEEATSYGPVSRLLGVDPTDMGDFLERVVHTEDRQAVREVFEPVRDGANDTYDVEFRTQPIDGKVRWMESRGYRQDPMDENPALLIGLATDVTERKRRERELQRQNERLDEFASVVSHDLRNPLSVAKGNLTLAMETGDTDRLPAVDRALDRMGALIEDLLELARHGGSVLEIEPVQLANAVEHGWQNVETARASLRLETDETVQADRSQLLQLVENLIRNALEHAGGDVTVTVGDLDGGFYVEDDGPGIPVDQREEVFDAGFSSSTDGTGFGLSIVKAVAESHGWDVAIESGDTGGARFEITGVVPA